MSEIKSRLLDAVKVAMCVQDKPRLTTLRLVLADIRCVGVDECIEVDDVRAPLILNRTIKQRRDAQRQFSDAGRQDLAKVETAEILALQDFMPKLLDDHKIDAPIERSIVNSSAQGPQDVGKAMSLLQSQVQGRVNMAQVSQRLKARLSS